MRAQASFQVGSWIVISFTEATQHLCSTARFTFHLASEPLVTGQCNIHGDLVLWTDMRHKSDIVEGEGQRGLPGGGGWRLWAGREEMGQGGKQ